MLRTALLAVAVAALACPAAAATLTAPTDPTYAFVPTNIFVRDLPADRIVESAVVVREGRGGTAGVEWVWGYKATVYLDTSDGLAEFMVDGVCGWSRAPCALPVSLTETSGRIYAVKLRTAANPGPGPRPRAAIRVVHVPAVDVLGRTTETFDTGSGRSRGWVLRTVSNPRCTYTVVEQAPKDVSACGTAPGSRGGTDDFADPDCMDGTIRAPSISMKAYRDECR